MCVCVCVCIEIVHCGESDQMIKMSGLTDKSLTKGLVVVVFYSLFQEFLQTEEILGLKNEKPLLLNLL